MNPEPSPSQQKLKTIFVITPIEKLDVDGFDFTRLFLDEIVKPAAIDAGGFRTPIRADEVRAPGSITAKVVRDIVKADICIADLTGRNPNVMYEVGIAHAADRPVILLQQETGGPPFDFTDERVIRYSTRADEANQARRQLCEFLRNAHQDHDDAILRETLHPVRTIFRDLQARDSATEPQQAILDKLDSISRRVVEIETSIQHNPQFTSGRVSDTKIRLQRECLSPDELEQLEMLSAILLSESAVQWLKNNIESKSPDYQLLRKVLGELKALVNSSASEKGRANRTYEIEELVRSIPPF